MYMGAGPSVMYACHALEKANLANPAPKHDPRPCWRVGDARIAGSGPPLLAVGGKQCLDISDRSTRCSVSYTLATRPSLEIVVLSSRSLIRPPPP